MACGFPLSSRVPRREAIIIAGALHACIFLTAHPKHFTGNGGRCKTNFVILSLFVLSSRETCLWHAWVIILRHWKIRPHQLRPVFWEHLFIKFSKRRKVKLRISVSLYLALSRCLWFSGQRVWVWPWLAEINLQCSWGPLVDKSWTSQSCRFSLSPMRANAWAS